MKLNWKIFKIAFAFLIAIGIILIAANSISPDSYSGTDLNFSVKAGTISVTNPSAEPALIQLQGSGYRTFNVYSTIDGVAGASVREGAGSNRVQLYDFQLPPGTSEFTVSGGSNVHLTTSTDPVLLQVTVHPMSNDTLRATIIAAIVAILGILFYVSNLTGHSWIRILSRTENKAETQPIAPAINSSQGPAPHSYGDNRTNITK